VDVDEVVNFHTGTDQPARYLIGTASTPQRAVIKSCTSCAADFSMVPGGSSGLSFIFFILNLRVAYFLLLTAEWIGN
jgi:hypothetical protein